MAVEVRAPKTFATPPTDNTPQDESSQKDDSQEDQKRYAWHNGQQRAVAVALETPPTTTQMIETNHYVPYETNRFQQAYTWATEQVARKLPATVETLRTLDSLIKQQVNAQEDKS